MVFFFKDCKGVNVSWTHTKFARGALWLGGATGRCKNPKKELLIPLLYGHGHGGPVKQTNPNI